MTEEIGRPTSRVICFVASDDRAGIQLIINVLFDDGSSPSDIFLGQLSGDGRPPATVFAFNSGADEEFVTNLSRIGAADLAKIAYYEFDPLSNRDPAVGVLLSQHRGNLTIGQSYTYEDCATSLGLVQIP